MQRCRVLHMEATNDGGANIEHEPGDGTKHTGFFKEIGKTCGSGGRIYEGRFHGAGSSTRAQLLVGDNIPTTLLLEDPLYV